MNHYKYSLLLLGGIGISNIGGWVYLIALNLIILKETGSPFAVALLYMLSPIATIFSNLWAGSLVDRINSRRLMLCLDMARAVCIAIIPISPSMLAIYLLAFMINIGSAMFEPTSMVYMTKLIPKENRQRFNALRSFINSCGTLLGPTIAGFLFWLGTPYTAIYVNALALFLSALLITFLPNVDSTVKSADKQKLSWQMIKRDFHSVYQFSKSNLFITKIYLLFCGMTIFMTAIDSLEAAFAKEVISLSDTNYGFLLSIFGIGIILGSMINTFFADQLQINLLIRFGTAITSIGYLMLYSSQGFISASISTFIIGFALTFANTGYLTFYQNHVPVTMMGRFGSLFSIVEAVFIILLTAVIGLSAELTSIRSVGWIGSLSFILLAIFTWRSVVGKSNNTVIAK
ncbi:MFS transporter [Gracilibacillus sp. S3-1-1]|uniref:MFS transporter n=1 Tax=Gracilibacillus pellucidus TaxID=3095368 RepID=A0ACC6M5K0_9BACI|nr:MFS transporter [Gracilibacillus sp. S3-1-1]MDX8046166.1 MFS transporter [Gracilibacillus sp. S3-1-1]